MARWRRFRTSRPALAISLMSGPNAGVALDWPEVGGGGGSENNDNEAADISQDPGQGSVAAPEVAWAATNSGRPPIVARSAL